MMVMRNGVLESLSDWPRGVEARHCDLRYKAETIYCALNPQGPLE